MHMRHMVISTAYAHAYILTDDFTSSSPGANFWFTEVVPRLGLELAT